MEYRITMNPKKNNKNNLVTKEGQLMFLILIAPL